VTAVHDNEEQELAEIERRLAQESPRLAARFEPISTAALATAGLGMLMLLVTGVVVMVAGARMAAPLVIVLAALLTATVPAAIGWFVHRHGTPPYR
jgi:hypothetical protein